MEERDNGPKRITDETTDFREMVEGNGIYVDKTPWMHRMLTENPLKTFFFIARPRRFGKTLAVSALKYILQGERELFKGLYIDGTDYDWKRRHVLHFDFQDVATENAEVFRASFAKSVRISLMDAGYAYDTAETAEGNFAFALDALYKKHGRLAVLIDEYDAPICHALADVKKAEYIRDRLAEFYINLKKNKAKIRFLFVTGVTAFAKASLFSSFNNLYNYSLDARYAGMFGYSQEELEKCFRGHMEGHAALMGIPYEQYRAELRRWYNGYRFAKKAEPVYNPVAIAMTLSVMDTEFGPTWTSLAGISLVSNYFERGQFLDFNLGDGPAYASRDGLIGKIELDALTPLRILYQAGYLTVDSYDPVLKKYRLAVPDEEIRRDLSTLVANLAAKKREGNWVSDMMNDFLKDNPRKFLAGLPTLFADLHYGSKEKIVQEFNYQRVLQTAFNAVGVKNAAEPVQSSGRRADIVAETATAVWIFELKRSTKERPAAAAEALAQIRGRGYAAPYRGGGRRVFLVGLAFNDATHELIETEWEEENKL